MKMPVEVLDHFAKLIENELGIVYSHENYYQLENRLEEIKRFFEIKDHHELLDRSLNKFNGPFKQYLLDVSTNNETSFFRDVRVFNILKTVILPKLIQNAKQRGTELKIWSVACSTGQEPLTLAMIIKDLLGPYDKLKVRILATDISDRVLTKAKLGRYSQLEVQRGLPAPLLIKYFTKTEDDFWQVKPEIKETIRFHNFNLISSPYPVEKFDLVLCRNVLIYQKVKSREVILDKLSMCLDNHGHLLLGAGESILGLKCTLEQKIVDGVPLYSIPAQATQLKNTA